MANAYELAVHGTWRGQNLVHTEQFRIVDAQANEDAYIADRWGVNCSGAYLDISPTDFTIQRVTCRKLDRPGVTTPSPLERPYGNAGTRQPARRAPPITNAKQNFSNGGRGHRPSTNRMPSRRALVELAGVVVHIQLDVPGRDIRIHFLRK